MQNLSARHIKVSAAMSTSHCNNSASQSGQGGPLQPKRTNRSTRQPWRGWPKVLLLAMTGHHTCSSVHQLFYKTCNGAQNADEWFTSKQDKNPLNQVFRKDY
mmetsp:Transcript_73859/g.196614  ORF Transcript_73859/g.196614 Transcript_73859/m.196614 type:complete len:102 (+) Transcript_73859:733-1038(+)